MSSVKIASNWNNEAGLQELEDLYGTLFADYAAVEGVRTSFQAQEALEMDGDMGYRPIGLPSATWYFYRLSRDEMAYLIENFAGTKVTICTLDKTTDTYVNYNARMKPIDLSDDAEWDLDGWDDVTLYFYNLVEL